MVPAKTGRLLRFKGDLFHAVPKPLNRWLYEGAASDESEDDSADLEWDASFLVGQRVGRVLENTSGGPLLVERGKDWADDEGSDISSELRKSGGPAVSGGLDLVRSVVLFNTWQVPPEGVETVPTTDPESIISNLAEEIGGPHIDALVATMALPDSHCASRTRWRACEPEKRPYRLGGDALRPMRVPLLGTKARRRQQRRTVEVIAPEGLLHALSKSSTVTSYKLDECALR